jgi:transcription elongation factor GreA-like protein
MSNVIIENLEKLLNEEKWTRATINNYTIKNFEAYNQIIKDSTENKLLSEMKKITEEYFRHNKN